MTNPFAFEIAELLKDLADFKEYQLKEMECD